LASFGRVVQQFQQALQLLSKEQEETKRLRELCEKNKIDYKPKPPITPPPSLPEIKK